MFHPKRIGCALALLLACACAAAQDIPNLIRDGNFAAAVTACDVQLKKTPRDHRIWTLKAIALQSAGQAAESLKAFRRALSIAPKFLPALQGSAQIEYATRDPNCRKTLESILKLLPNEPTAHGMLGALAFEERDCARTVGHYEKAGDALLQPVSRWQLATCDFELERWDAAEAQFRALLRVREDDALRYNLALTQWNGGRFKDAISTLEPIAQKPVPIAGAMSLLAAAYESDQQTDAAVRILRRALGLYPRDERLYTELGSLCLNHNAIPLGIEVLEVGTKNVPQSARIHAMLGVLQARGGLSEQAEASFQNAERLAPDATFATIGLAVTLMQLNAPDAAIRALRQKLQKTPDDVPVLTTMAEAMLQVGNSPAELDQAQPLLEKVVALDPSNSRALALLGKVHLEREDMAKAIMNLEAAIRLDPSNRPATYQLMLAYQREGREQEAARLQVQVRALLEAERTQEAQASRFQLVRAPEVRPAK